MSGFPLRRGLQAVLMGGVVVVTVGSAPADVFLGVSNTSLLRFDTTAQTCVVVAPLVSGGSGLTAMEDCDFDGGGTLWAVRQGSLGGFPPTPVNRAYTIDTTSGNSTQQGDFGSGAQLQSLAFANTAFYSVNGSGGTTTGHLVFADLVAGTVTSVGGQPHGLPVRFQVDALAFAPDGTLFGVYNGGSGPPFGSNDYKLVRFNPSNGLGAVIGSIGTSANTFVSLRFDSAGTAFTVDVNTGDVYTVSLATGQGTFAFAGGAAAMGTRGIALVAVPAPGAGLLLGAGLLGLRRRRR